MKLWIIYKEGFLISKVIAEILQDRLENYIDVSVGKAGMINPSFIVEEELNYLIIGDIISKTLPSKVIQNWVIKYRESNIINLSLKALSGFLITQNEIEDTLWAEFIQSNIQSKTFNPPILHLKLDRSHLVSETDVHEFQLLKATIGLEIHGFVSGNRSFGSVICYHATVNGQRDAAILIIKRTHHHKNVVEVIAPLNLREKLNLSDGDTITVKAQLFD